MSGDWRFYRQAGQVGVGRGAMLAYLGMGALVVSADAASKHPVNIVLAVLVFAVLLFTAARSWYLVPKFGVAESDVGLMSQSDPGWLSFKPKCSSVAWDDIDAFVVVPGLFPGQSVYASSRSGGRVRLAVRQGRPIRWNGGETKDIASVLAERTNEVLRAKGRDQLVAVTHHA